MSDFIAASPIRAWRRQVSFSIADLALASGVYTAEVSRAERGAPIPRKLFAYLVASGLDGEELDRAHEEFRRSKAEALNERLRASRAEAARS